MRMSTHEMALTGIVLIVAAFAAFVIWRWSQTNVGPTFPVRDIPRWSPWRA